MNVTVVTYFRDACCSVKIYALLKVIYSFISSAYFFYFQEDGIFGGLYDYFVLLSVY